MRFSILPEDTSRYSWSPTGSTPCATAAPKQNHADLGRQPVTQSNQCLVKTHIFSLSPSFILSCLVDHLTKHVSHHLPCVNQVTVQLSLELLGGGNEGTGVSLVGAQSLYPGDVNKILGPGRDMLWGISVCRDTNKHMESARDWPYTDWLMSPWSEQESVSLAAAEHSQHHHHKHDFMQGEQLVNPVLITVRWKIFHIFSTFQNPNKKR